MHAYELADRMAGGAPRLLLLSREWVVGSVDRRDSIPSLAMLEARRGASRSNVSSSY
jgi:hypothetical protein